MGWGDIDFDNIVTGATTVDVNSEQNFYGVLDQFAWALDERLNVVTPSQNATPELPGIVFNIEGEIRAGATFWGKYKDMLQGYFNLWNDFDWYNPDALTDPLNAEDYLLEDIDLEVAMGINAYDLLINRDSKNRVELWSADLLNGLYELYKLTQVHKLGLVQLNFNTDVKYNAPVFFRNSDLALAQSSPVASGNPYSAALADWNSIKMTDIGFVGSTPWITIWRQDLNGNGDQWSILTGFRDNSTVTIKSVNLFGENIGLTIVGTGAELVSNYITESYAEALPTVAYTDNYLKVGPNDPTVLVEVEPKNITLDANLGLRYQFFEYGSPDEQGFPPFITPSDTSPSGNASLDVEFIIKQSTDFLIDVNNSELEFFIAEEEED